MARAKARRKKEPFAVVRSVKLTPRLDQLLQDIAQDAADFCGWPVAASTIVRVLVRYLEQQPPGWVREQLFPLLDQEIAAGVTWGGKK